MMIRVRRNKKGCKKMVIKGGAVMNMVAFGKKVADRPSSVGLYYHVYYFSSIKRRLLHSFINKL